MIYVTGDAHNNAGRWKKHISPLLSDGDMIIVCGDLGFGFDSDGDELLKLFENEPYTVLFADGNHENFDKLYAYPIESWLGGRVHKILPNVIHLMRGEIYSIDGHSVFVMGGGYSIDKYRRTEGVSWWRQEMPSKDEYKNAQEHLQRADHRVDYIITHTAPSETVYYLSTLRSFGIKNDVFEEFELTSFLDNVRRETEYKHWYFGHFHVDAELWRNQTAMLNTVRELAGGKIVGQWEAAEF